MASFLWLWFDSDVPPTQVLAPNFSVATLVGDFAQFVGLPGFHSVFPKLTLTSETAACDFELMAGDARPGLLEPGALWGGAVCGWTELESSGIMGNKCHQRSLGHHAQVLWGSLGIYVYLVNEGRKQRRLYPHTTCFHRQ